MYYHQPQPRHRRAQSYFLPFLVIIGLFAVLFFGWKIVHQIILNEPISTENEGVFLTIESGSVKAMTLGKAEWQSAPDQINLYRGERLKTGIDGRATLTFFDKSIARLNTNTEVEFTTLKKKKDVSEISTQLDEGELFAKVERINNPDSSFAVTTSFLTVDSRGGTFAVSSPGTVYMIDGFAQVSVRDQGEIVKNYTLGVGQQFAITEEEVKTLKENPSLEVIYALSDEFKQTNWYQWNMKKEGALTSEAQTVAPVSQGETTTTSLPDTAATPPLPVQSSESVTAPETDGDDSTPPSKPVITSPAAVSGKVELKDIEQEITGTVSADTQSVTVNDYKLGKYLPGSKTFSYRAKTTFDNLKVGDNEFKIWAEDKAGNKSDPALIVLHLSQEVFDAKTAEAKAKAESGGSTSSAAFSKGGVKITAPNNGENFSTKETSFEITGVVPENAAKVVVNDYTLTGYTPGSTSFKYKASSTFKNLVIGEVNLYKVTAYDKDEVEIGSAQISIDVESGSAGAPQITIPADAETYNTTLSDLVVGGTVGKWTTAVYVNGKKLTDYIPGSEKWSTSITLSPGANKISVEGEQAGEKLGGDQITITLQ